MSSLSTAPKMMVEMHHVSKRFGSVTVLNDISLSFPEGSATATIGPSESGKTTVIRCINHLLPIDSGIIRISGELLGYRQDERGQLIGLAQRLKIKHQPNQFSGKMCSSHLAGGDSD